MTRICILQGHPHPTGQHYCHALATAYRTGAEGAGHSVTSVDIGAMALDFLRDPAAMTAPPSDAIRTAQDAILVAEHLMIVYPLWLGTMPAVVKAFFEQVSCDQFLIGKSRMGWPLGKLKGRSARLVVTMGMPSAAYRLLMGADGVRGFESGILGIAGIRPIRESLLGGVEAAPGRRARWLLRMAELGARAR